MSGVGRAHPQYGGVDLGDPRIRDVEAITGLAQKIFANAQISFEPGLFSMRADAAMLAVAASGFFYSSLVLESFAREPMLADLEALFARQGDAPVFHLPVNRLVVEYWLR